MKKYCPYVIAPTEHEIHEGISILKLPDGKLMIHPLHGMALDKISHVHIYILSDESYKDIKVGDWVWDSIPDEDEYAVFQVDSIVEKSGLCRSKTFTTTLDSCKKIIAATNPALHSKYHNLPTKYHSTNDFVEGIPSILKSDIEYIISIYNEKDKGRICIERLADEYRFKHPKGNSDIMLAFEDGYNKCMQDNAEKIFTLQQVYGILRYAEDNTKSNERGVKLFFDGNVALNKDIVMRCLQENPSMKMQPKDALIVEYENSNSGWQQLANNGKQGSTFVLDCYIPKLKDGNIIIVKD